MINTQAGYVGRHLSFDKTQLGNILSLCRLVTLFLIIVKLEQVANYQYGGRLKAKKW